MSNEDISIVCNVLQGISNPNKEIRTSSVNKLQELSNNLGALTYCLLDIASKVPTNDKEKIIKTTALVIGRKILSMKDSDVWKATDNTLKEKIKLKALNLLNTEVDPSQNSKLCDFISNIYEHIKYSDESWKELDDLTLSILNFDPNDNSKSLQIRTLLKLLCFQIGYRYNDISNLYDKLIPYLNNLFDSKIDISIKSIASEFVCNLLSFCKEEELSLFSETVKKICSNIYNCTLIKGRLPEENIKSMIEDCIEMCGYDDKILFNPIFKDIYTLCQQIINKKDEFDDKVRELAFEFILTIVEYKPTLLKSKKKNPKLLVPFLEMTLSYALEFDKTLEQEWNTPSGNIYNDKADDEMDDKVKFALNIIDRVVECMGIDECEKELKSILEIFLQKTWEYKYIAYYILGRFSEYDQEITKVEKIFPLLFNEAKSNEPRLRFSALHCINTFCDYYNPNFQTTTIKTLIPLLLEILKFEPYLRNQCEIISTLTSFIQFTQREELKPYVQSLLEQMFNYFQKNDIPTMKRKLVTENILEIITTMEEDITPFAPVSFDLLFNYFCESYKNKQNQILYGCLIESIISIGEYTKEKFNKIIPDMVKCISEIVTGFSSDKFEPIRADLTNSLDRLLPSLQENYKNLIPNLIQTVFTLVRLRPKMSISSTPEEEFEVNKLLEDKDEEDEEKKDMQTSETEDLAQSLSLLNTFIVSLESQFFPYIEKVEEEIIQLIQYKADSKIRKKSSKVLPNLIKTIQDKNLKKTKGKYYLKILIGAIEKETNYDVCYKFFVRLRELIEECEDFLNKSELGELFNKIIEYFNNVRDKRMKLLEKRKARLKKHKDDDSDDEQIEDLIKSDIESIENIEDEISDNIGLLLKTHKPIADDLVSILISKIVPQYIQSKDDFEIKMGLYIADDLIEYIGQEKMGNDAWSLMFKIVTTLTTHQDSSLRHAASYGIGIFALHTSKDFDNYASGLITALFNGLNIKYKEGEIDEKDEDYKNFGLSVDNMVSALGKIINSQLKNSKIVQNGINEILTKWIMGLPIKYDDIEHHQQHEWLADLFLTQRQLIGENCYEHYFETLAKIYETKLVNEKTNEKIKTIFQNFVLKEDKLKQIVEKVYNSSEETIKLKLKKLFK